jgi:hypothetical protein
MDEDVPVAFAEVTPNPMVVAAPAAAAPVAVAAPAAQPAVLTTISTPAK